MHPSWTRDTPLAPEHLSTIKRRYRLELFMVYSLQRHSSDLVYIVVQASECRVPPSPFSNDGILSSVKSGQHDKISWNPWSKFSRRTQPINHLRYVIFECFLPLVLIRLVGRCQFHSIYGWKLLSLRVQNSGRGPHRHQVSYNRTVNYRNATSGNNITFSSTITPAWKLANSSNGTVWRSSWCNGCQCR